MSYSGLGTGFDVSHAGAPYKGMLGLGAENNIPKDTVSVRALQKLLLKKGFSVGSAGVDGIWGPDTKKGFREACEAEDLLVDREFCKDVDVSGGKRNVRIPAVLYKGIRELPDNPLPDPSLRRKASAEPAPSPLDMSLKADNGKKVWPWVIGLGGGALLLGGVWWWYQQEQQARPVTPNRRRRRRRR